jgi:hypothetical protein
MINYIDNLKSTICRRGPCVSQRSEDEQAGVNQGSPSADTVQISREGYDRLRAPNKQSDLNLAMEALSPEQSQAVEKLKKRDQEVKAHEKAHTAAGAGIVQGGATYQYQRGPDGKMYAVGGEVKIDTAPERDPEETIRKMQQVRKAALAPTQPSAQDRSVAAQASQIEAEARAELTKKNAEETKEKEEDPSAAVIPSLAGIAESPHKISNIGHRIDITA